jgi:hypothetical protein
MKGGKPMNNNEVFFEVETLQDWRIEAGANQIQPEVPAEGGGASNSNSTNNSADEP